MKLLCSGIYLFCLLAAANAAKAEDAAFRSDDGAIRISGRACERFTPNEAKSTIRVRVTDKASFLAVSSAAEVSALRDEMNEHDYNVLVYNLVDNAVEDLAVRTTKQDAEELCVEAEGYIHPDSILQAMAEQAESEPDADSRETMTDIVNEVNTSYSEIEGGKPEVIPPTDETDLAKQGAGKRCVAACGSGTSVRFRHCYGTFGFGAGTAGQQARPGICRADRIF